MSRNRLTLGFMLLKFNPDQLRMNRHAVSNILIAAILITVTPLTTTARPAQARACNVVIATNDPQSRVFVDHTELTQNPQARAVSVPCTDNRQAIRVVSSDQQAFIRSIPALSELNDAGTRDVKWNVSFREPSNFRGVSTIDHVEIESGDKTLILKELTKLRSMVAELIAVKNSFVRSENTAGSFTSGRSVAQAEPSEFYSLNKGLYVQIYSVANLRAANLTLTKQERELIKIQKLEGASALLVCQWLKNSHFSRILVGPLQDSRAAAGFAQAVGRDSFVVRDPKCGS